MAEKDKDSGKPGVANPYFWTHFDHLKSSQSTPSSPRLLTRRRLPSDSKYSNNNSKKFPQNNSENNRLSDDYSDDGTLDTLDEINWQKRCIELQLKLHLDKQHADRAQETLCDKLTEMEHKMLEAENRADEAQEQMRFMEERLASSSQDNGTEIQRLETEIEEQRQLRLQDARQVEAKAARIKEWVTFKLRELEQQNQTLREQNLKCNQQLELLRKHLALTDIRRRSGSSSPELSCRIMPETAPTAAPIPRNHPSLHRRHQSMCLTTSSTTTNSSTNTISGGGQIAPPPIRTSGTTVSSDDLKIIPTPTMGTASAINTTSSSLSDPDLTQNDYAEIFTPCVEIKPDFFDALRNRPPTPPIHRFPSWENRIYQVASDGLATVTNDSTTTATAPAPNERLDNNGTTTTMGCYQDLPVPVYATVKGRASQIRSVPFTGDSSDETSDEEGGRCRTISSEDNSDSTGSPSLLKGRVTSFGSSLSDDYAVPPDALSYDTTSLESTPTNQTPLMVPPLPPPVLSVVPPNPALIEKHGWLSKLGGKFKTWRKKYFILRNGVLFYYKNEHSTKAQGEIQLDDMCKIIRTDISSNTFEIDTGKKMYYLTADTASTMDDWVRILQQIQSHNTTLKLLDNKPTIQGWLTKVKNGHARKYWSVLIGKVFFYYKVPPVANESNTAPPTGQIQMRDVRIEEIEHFSDSDSDEDRERSCCGGTTIGIFFTDGQGPTYLLCSNKQDKDSWLYHLTVASGGGPTSGTQYEQLIHKLMELDGDPMSPLWRHPVLQYVPCTTSTSTPSSSAPLTTLSTECQRTEAVKLFKCLQLFMSAAVDHAAGIDYHVVLAQNALQQCLEMAPLQAELFCALIKQTSNLVPLNCMNSSGTGAPPSSQTNSMTFLATVGSPGGSSTHSKSHKKSNFLLCAPCETITSVNSLCDDLKQAVAALQLTASPPPASPHHHHDEKLARSRPAYTLLQGWQLLALAVSLFVPRSSRLLWFLKLHLQRNSGNSTECGKYAAYCERALQRTIQTGARLLKPSRMEVLSILLKNPQHHSLPHSIPVHLLITNTYHITSFDGSTTIREFQENLARAIACRTSNGFSIFSDDPIEKDVEQYLDPNAKLCDLISKWESILREKGAGKFETSKVIKFTYKNRLWWRQSARLETEKERLLLCYQTNQQIVAGRFPLNHDLAMELAAIMAQLDLGDFTTGNTNNSNNINSGSTQLRQRQILSAIDRFYPYRYRDQYNNGDNMVELQTKLAEKWTQLKGRTQNDCVRIYLTCTRKWPFFGATLFQAKLRQNNSMMVWLAINEDAITLLDLATMQPRVRYPYTDVMTFGGCQDDFMLVVSTQNDVDSQQPSLKLTFMLSKPKILELTVLIADYMNLLNQQVPGTPLLGTLNRGTMISVNQMSIVGGSGIIQPDILKSTPDHDFDTVVLKRRTSHGGTTITNTME